MDTSQEECRSPRRFKNLLGQLFRQKHCCSPQHAEACPATLEGGKAWDPSSTCQDGRAFASTIASKGSSHEEITDLGKGAAADSCHGGWSSPRKRVGLPRPGVPSDSRAASGALVPGLPLNSRCSETAASTDMVASIACVSGSVTLSSCGSMDLTSALPPSPCCTARRGTARGPNGQLLASVDEVYAQLMDDIPSCASSVAGAPVAPALGSTAAQLSRTSTITSGASTICLGPQLSIPLSDAVSSPQTAAHWDDLAMPGLARLRIARRSSSSDASTGMNMDDAATTSSVSDWQSSCPAASTAAVALVGAGLADSAPLPAGIPAAAAAPASSAQHGCSYASGMHPSLMLARHKSMPRLQRPGPGCSSSSSSLHTPLLRSSCSATCTSDSSSTGPGSSAGPASGSNSTGSHTSAAHRVLFPASASGLTGFARLRAAASAPEHLDLSATADELVKHQDSIRQVNQDNVLSVQFGPAHRQLLSFRYCAATSPLSQPGRSPFGSPRAPRELSEFASCSPAPGRVPCSYQQQQQQHQHQQHGSNSSLAGCASCSSPVVGTPPCGSSFLGVQGPVAPTAAAGAAAMLSPAGPPAAPLRVQHTGVCGEAGSLGQRCSGTGMMSDGQQLLHSAEALPSSDRSVAGTGNWLVQEPQLAGSYTPSSAEAVVPSSGSSSCCSRQMSQEGSSLWGSVAGASRRSSSHLDACTAPAGAGAMQRPTSDSIAAATIEGQERAGGSAMGAALPSVDGWLAATTAATAVPAAVTAEGAAAGAPEACGGWGGPGSSWASSSSAAARLPSQQQASFGSRAAPPTHAAAAAGAVREVAGVPLQLPLAAAGSCPAVSCPGTPPLQHHLQAVPGSSCSGGAAPEMSPLGAPCATGHMGSFTMSDSSRPWSSLAPCCSDPAGLLGRDAGQSPLPQQQRGSRPSGSHPSRLSQNAVPAHSFAVTRTRSSSSSCEGAEAAWVLPELPEVDFIERIGSGCYGEVYRGIWNDAVVAVKVVSAKRSAHHSLVDHEEQLSLELARHEYESWINANVRHPNIIQLFTSFTVCLDSAPTTAPEQLHSPQPSPSDRFRAVTGVAALLGSGQQPIPPQQEQQQAAVARSSTGAGEALGGEGGARLAAEPGAVVITTSSRRSSSGSEPAGFRWKTHLVMEYCDMGTLLGAIKAGWFRCGEGIPRLDFVLATAKEVCVAVAYLHAMDVVHGDLKGTNVLLKGSAVTRHDGRGFVAKVADFGLSRVMDNMGQALPVAQQGFGALTHAAPELLLGQPLCMACDVFSAGVLLWELVTGQAAFAGVLPGEVLCLKLHCPSSELLAFPSDTPPALVQLAQACWTAEPTLRPDMSAVVSELNSIALDLLGLEWCLGMFPDVARLASSRRGAAGGSCYGGCL